MNDNSRKMKLGAFLYPTAHHLAGSRHPQGQADVGLNLRHYIDVARKAEEGKLDFIFFADTLGPAISLVRLKDGSLSLRLTRRGGEFRAIVAVSDWRHASAA
jgi:alkanesulfonate monooxygenase SsuD/methylene tetrahydromethanopterin reductase-like flavin-dependent oxidoreductase (luciferase family)